MLDSRKDTIFDSCVSFSKEKNEIARSPGWGVLSHLINLVKFTDLIPGINDNYGEN